MSMKNTEQTPTPDKAMAFMAALCLKANEPRMAQMCLLELLAYTAFNRTPENLVS